MHGSLGCSILFSYLFGRLAETSMSIPWATTVSVVDMVWAVLAAWVSSCLAAAAAVARSVRTGELIGPFRAVSWA